MKAFVGIITSALVVFGAELAAAQDADQDAQPRAADEREADIGRMATTNTSRVGPAERFGDSGTLTISSDAALTIQRSSTSGVSGGTTTVSLAPAADYFVGGRVSLGGFIGFDYVKVGGDHATRFAIGPRIGYDLVLSDMVSLWPRAGISLAATDATSSALGGSSSGNDTTVALNLFVPIVFHPAVHFLVGFGPFLDTDLSGDTRTTVFGARLTVGGWMRV